MHVTVVRGVPPFRIEVTKDLSPASIWNPNTRSITITAAAIYQVRVLDSGAGASQQSWLETVEVRIGPPAAGAAAPAGAPAARTPDPAGRRPRPSPSRPRRLPASPRPTRRARTVSWSGSA